MIEIGDPTEEPPADQPEPRVVIEYHERGGVPWMLIPPLLVLSAVGAVLLYVKFSPQAHPHPFPSLAKVEVPAEPLITDGPKEGQNAPAPQPEVPAEPVQKVEPKAEEPPPSVAPQPSPVGAEPPTIQAEPVELPKVAEPPAFPRVDGLGFDPKALEAERKVEAPAPADAAIAPVIRQEPPDDRDLPREIDPDLLPPDPRQAKVRQENRRLEMRRRIEEERIQFHADLKAICRKYREKSGPEILEMRKQYDLKIDPKAEEAAIELLGKNGKYVGVDRRTRVELLRTLGYPEPVILDQIFSTYERRQIGERGGPRDLDEAYYFSALFMLRNPPRLVGPSSRPVSAPGNGTAPTR